jgi:hypothetical protein
VTRWQLLRLVHGMQGVELCYHHLQPSPALLPVLTGAFAYQVMVKSSRLALELAHVQDGGANTLPQMRCCLMEVYTDTRVVMSLLMLLLLRDMCIVRVTQRDLGFHALRSTRSCV